MCASRDAAVARSRAALGRNWLAGLEVGELGRQIRSDGVQHGNVGFYSVTSGGRTLMKSKLAEGITNASEGPPDTPRRAPHQFTSDIQLGARFLECC